MNTLQDYINDKVLAICKKGANIHIAESEGQLVCDFDNIETEDNLTLRFSLDTDGRGGLELILDNGVIHIDGKDYSIRFDGLEGLEYPDYILIDCEEYYSENMYDINEMPDDTRDRT